MALSVWSSTNHEIPNAKTPTAWYRKSQGKFGRSEAGRKFVTTAATTQARITIAQTQ